MSISISIRTGLPFVLSTMLPHQNLTKNTTDGHTPVVLISLTLVRLIDCYHTDTFSPTHTYVLRSTTSTNLLKSPVQLFPANPLSTVMLSKFSITKTLALLTATLIPGVLSSLYVVHYTPDCLVNDFGPVGTTVGVCNSYGTGFASGRWVDGPAYPYAAVLYSDSNCQHEIEITGDTICETYSQVVNSIMIIRP